MSGIHRKLHQMIVQPEKVNRGKLFDHACGKLLLPRRKEGLHGKKSRRCHRGGCHMKIGIVGAGKVGTTLGKYLSHAGIFVTGFYSRSKESADEAATFAGTKAYQQLTELIRDSDVLFLTVPDGAIGQVWQEIAGMSLGGMIICHFSGSLSSHVFSDMQNTGASGVSVHPMYAFSDKFTSYQQFHTAYLTMEGQEPGLTAMRQLFQELGHTVYTLRSEDKMKYHAAAALASNAMLGLVQTSLEILEECGFDQRAALELLTPLVQGNISSMLEKGCVEALTGPVERNDIQTVRKHLEVLQGSQAESIYRSLAPTLLQLAKCKNPDRDYAEMEKLLKGKVLT